MSKESFPEGEFRRRKQASVEDKFDGVMRVLKGEDRAKVASDLGVSTERLGRWEHTFVSGGRSALVQSAQSWQSHRHRRKISGGMMAAIAAAILGLTLAGIVLYRIIFQPPMA